MIDNEQLISIVERLERFNDEIIDANAHKKHIMNEAKGLGFSPKAIGHIIKQRKKDRDQRAEEKSLFETYENAIGLD